MPQTKTKRRIKAPKTTKTSPAPAPAEPKRSRIVHDLPGTYAGPSGITTSRKSRTALPIDTFGSLADAPLTARDRAAISDIASRYGRKQFQRGNLDAGILRRLGQRNMISHVSGDDVSETTTFKLTAAAHAAVAEATA